MFGLWREGRTLKITVIGHDQLSPRQYLLWKKMNDLGLAEVQVLAPERWGPEYANPNCVTPCKTLYEGDINRYMMDVEPHILQFKPDWIVSMTEQWRQQTAINLQLARWNNIKFACFRWENIPIDKQLPPDMRMIQRSVFEHANLLICGNKEAEEITKSQTEKPTVRLLETGIDTDTFKPADVPKQYDVLYVGRQVPEKGIDTIRKATEGLSLKINDGTTPYDELPKLMSSARVGVVGSVDLPGWKEQCCYVIGEMLACGVPVVSTDAGSIPEIWGGCDIISIVPQNDSANMGHQLNYWMRASVCRITPTFGHGWIRRHYSNEKLAHDYVERLNCFA